MAKQTGAAKQLVLKEVEVKASELVTIANMLTRVVPKKGSVENAKNLVRLTRLLKSRVEEFFEQQKLLFAGYGLEPEGDSYNWQEHKDKKEIDQKVEELANGKVLLIPTNFMSEADFYLAVDGFNTGQIEILEKVLSENPV